MVALHKNTASTHCFSQLQSITPSALQNCGFILDTGSYFVCNMCTQQMLATNYEV